MKNYLQIIFASILLMLVLSNCNKTPDNGDTKPARPTASTDTALTVSQTWATIYGWVKAGNLLTTVSFEYDTDEGQPVFRYAIYSDTLSGNSSTRFTAHLIDLESNTTYYYYIKAVNSLGETHGIMREFTTLEIDTSTIAFNPDLAYGEVSDIEDNIYKTIKIGNQTWMAQNLAVTKYNNGEQIPLVIANSEWQDTLVSDAYSWYDNIEIKYGALYNWYAASSDKLCPVGWRVSTDDDWATLINYLGGKDIAGGKLKETGSVHWTTPNVGATNSSGFTGLPGGYKFYGTAYDAITYDAIKKYGYWWTSTSETLKNAVSYRLYYGYANIDKMNLDKRVGTSVRCLKE